MLSFDKTHIEFSGFYKSVNRDGIMDRLLSFAGIEKGARAGLAHGVIWIGWNESCIN